MARPDIIVRTQDGPVIVEVELDQRVVRDMLGLDSRAEATIERLRLLLASEPSIHGAKRAELPASDNA
jgi:hypothetical protein